MNNIPYARQWIEDEDIMVVAASMDGDWLTQGPGVKAFEDAVADYCGARYAVAVNSGTAALHLASLVAEVRKGDEVITSPITFVASANCVLYCGGRPVFADICPDTMNIDPDAIKKKITSKTKAIIPVDFAGHPCDLEVIHRIARKHGLTVVEDAAHALGAKYNRKKIGSCNYSDMTVLSFHAVKHITTGEGGMILTNNKLFYEKLLMLRTHGITREKKKLNKTNDGDWYYEMQFLGYNYRITDFQCALGTKQMERLRNFIERRREIVERYNNAFKEVEGITIPIEKKGIVSSWHIYVIRVKERRREIFDALRRSGIGVNVHYIPVYLQPYYQALGYKKGLCPNAEDYYRSAITLPLFPRMKDYEVNRVISRVRECVLRKRS